MMKVFKFLIGAVLIFALIYGMYWVAKTASYQIFYEDMVEETVKEMVKSQYLK